MFKLSILAFLVIPWFFTTWLVPSVPPLHFPFAHVRALAEAPANNVLALDEDVGRLKGAAVVAALKQRYGDAVKTWSIQEANGTNFVISYPYVSDSETREVSQSVTQLLNQ